MVRVEHVMGTTVSIDVREPLVKPNMPSMARQLIVVPTIGPTVEPPTGEAKNS